MFVRKAAGLEVTESLHLKVAVESKHPSPELLHLTVFCGSNEDRDPAARPASSSQKSSFFFSHSPRPFQLHAGQSSLHLQLTLHCSFAPASGSPAFCSVVLALDDDEPEAEEEVEVVRSPGLLFKEPPSATSLIGQLFDAHL